MPQAIIAAVRHCCRHRSRHRCRQRCRHRSRDNQLRLSLARGAALQYELGLVLQHQYSLGPIVPLNCVRPSAVRGVRVYQTSNMRGLFHLRDVDGIDTWMLPLYQKLPDCRNTVPHNSQRVACVLPSTRKAANHIVKTVRFAAVRGALSTVRC